MKLYRSAIHPGCLLAYIPGTGWMVFPAKAGGWERREPARGIDPVHLRQIPLRMAANTGMLEEQEAGELVATR
jgi:hypothetical protein